MQDFAQAAGRVVTNVEKVIVGKHREVELAVTSLLCKGHILIEDVPGVGKTMLSKALARSLGCTFKRIQFTPDLLPSDVTGVSIYNQQTQTFEFRPGQITVDGVTYPLPEPFVVLATQNPIEYEGTFPLPEAQLDRFFMRIQLGYPSERQEVEILDAQAHQHPIETLGQVADTETIVEAQRRVSDIHVAPAVKDYVVRVVAATRSHPDVYLGASPRGSLALVRAAQAFAAIQGRDFVVPDDVKLLAAPTLSHRLILQPAARLRDLTTATVVAEVLQSVPVEPGAFARAAAG